MNGTQPGARRDRARAAPIRRVVLLGAVAVLGLAMACAPVMPQRRKAGGAARWAVALAQMPAVQWARDARLCKITGSGVATDGWLPDRGGAWVVTWWSDAHPEVLEVTVDTDGRTTSRTVENSPVRGHPLPADWQDSPRVWAATRSHLQGRALNTFEAAFAWNLEPERFPGQAVWRLRFFLAEGGSETHYVSADARWLAREAASTR